MTSAAMRVLILGTGGFAVEVAEIVEQTPGWEVAGFVQNLWPERRGESLEGRPVYFAGELGPLCADHVAVCGLGKHERIAFIRQVEGMGMRFVSVAHPAAVVSRSAELGQGCVIAAGAVIGARVRLGRHAVVNRNASVGHDTMASDFVFVGPGAVVASACEIGEGVLIGAGAVVRDHLRIGERSIIGAGACALQNVPARTMVSAARSVLLE